MKRLSIITLCLCFLGGSVWADYINSPGWDNDPYFTHQSWSFAGMVQSTTTLFRNSLYCLPWYLVAPFAPVR